jgi:H+-transporting ATPase
VKPAVEKTVEEFAARGFRSLGVARAKADGEWQFLGVLPLFDPPQEDAKTTIATALQMGVKVKMVTGDQLAIAKETAKKLGMGTNILDASSLGDIKNNESGAADKAIENADGFAQVFPEHKFHIVDVLQKLGHIVGMTGDGVNDAPALKQADCGIAVSGATDAARAAAAIVLMKPGLSVIIDAIKESRRIFQRMNSYAIYRIAETLRVLFFMTLAILVFNFYPLTAVMIVMLALLNDGAILSIAYDTVHYKDKPEAWNMRMVLGISTVLGVIGVVAAFGLFYLGERVFHLDRAVIQTLMYLKLSVAGHLTIFLTRTRGPFWSIRPARILLIAVFGTQTVATLIAVYGLFMTPLGWGWALFVWGYALAWFLVNDRVKLLAYWAFAPVENVAAKTLTARAPATSQGEAPVWSLGGWRLPTAALALIVLGFGGGWLASQDLSQKQEADSAVRTVTASGTIAPIMTTAIDARVAGVIDALHCAVGAKVKAGELCAKVDPRPYQAILKQDNANLISADLRLTRDRAGLARAKEVFERYGARAKRGRISRNALDRVRNAYERAQTQTKLEEAMVGELQAMLKASQINLGHTDIVSPIDGTVVARNVEADRQATAVSGARLFLIAADMTVVEITANLSEADIGAIKLGDKASFTVRRFPNRSFVGEVTEIRSSAHPRRAGAPLYDVVITAPNPELALESDMAATILITSTRRREANHMPGKTEHD